MFGASPWVLNAQLVGGFAVGLGDPCFPTAAIDFFRSMLGNGAVMTPAIGLAALPLAEQGRSSVPRGRKPMFGRDRSYREHTGGRFRPPG